MPIYAQFGVPEVWRWIDGKLEIHRLQGESYVTVTESHCLPGFPVSEATTLLEQRHEVDETRLLAMFRKSCRNSPQP
jgi:hypothetical protein